MPVLHKGFTIIELVIVLLLISLIAGLVLPRFSNIYNNAILSYEKDDAINQLSGLGYTAFQNGKPIILSNNSQQSLTLKEDWEITSEHPIFYYANGACAGGDLILSKQNKKYKIQLLPPFCRPQISL